MKLLLALMSVVLIGTSSLGIADEREPVTEIALGLYENKMVQAIGKPIKVTTGGWVDEYTLETCLKYGRWCFDTTYTIARVNDNLFEGTGTMRLFEGCSYPVSIKVKAYSDRLFIKESAPSNVYTTQEGYLSCAPVKNVETAHREPFLKIQ